MPTNNKFSLKNYLFLFLLLIAITLLTLILISSKDTKELIEKQPFVDSFTVSVPVPDDIEFCNQTISLKRLDMRERFDREINSFTYFHSTTLLYLKRANRYFPVIEPILKKNGIPDDFKYLAVIESGLDERALSPAKAAGLWQFMETTGKSYGLEIRSEVDERYHTIKATEAACNYLKDAYQQFGNWIDVAVAYNAGTNRISTQMSKQYVDSAFDLLLVSESSRYVFRIMAVKQIFMNPQRYGFILKKEDVYPLVNVNYVDVSSDISDLAAFAKTHGINYMILKDYNLWLRDTQITIPRSSSKIYRIAIPEKEELYFDRNRV
ncbi:MAG: lytic transglycosylase domain-containing protein, partial [Dysgonamonadaceae bacterium]|nr:lytic transglycosylase domain-containing protein [Dysgonamonadaceae bacterium]